LDLEGGYVLPGFVDTHLHLTSMALKSLRCDLSGATSAGDVCDRLTAWSKGVDAPHVVGVEWDESNWEDAAYPTREALDAVDAKRPVLARRICGHVGVANTVLLNRLGELSAGLDAGLVDRASGLLLEHAIWEAGRLCAPDAGSLAAGFEGAIRELHALGITAIHDIVGTDKFEAYLEGITASRAPLRIDMLLVTEPRDFPRFRKAVEASGIENVRLVGIKCFLDGSLGGRTAALNRPYEASGDRGVLLMDSDTIRDTLRQCYDNDYMCAMHAIGDRAIDQAMDALSGLPRTATHFRLEHCEVVGTRQLDALKRAPVFLSMQPNFVRNWGGRGGLYERRLGAGRHARMNPFRTLLEAGVNFVFGSDGMPPGPLYGLRGATHHPLERERLTPGEAIDRYTRLPYTVGAHRCRAGVLEAGQRADLVVLDKSPLEADVESVQVLRTMVGGRFVIPGDTREARVGL
jgi:predicted amidohydrolase YtcJ